MIGRGVLEVDSSERRTKEGVRDGDRYDGHTRYVYFDFLWMIRINRYPGSVLHFPSRFTMHSVDSELGILACFTGSKQALVYDSFSNVGAMNKA